MFKFQPSEIGELDLEEFLDWVNEGKRQNDAELDAIEKAKG